MRDIASRDRGLRKRFADQVRKRREAKNWTQAELARQLDDSNRTRVIRVEKGETAITLFEVLDLARVFDADPVEFLVPIVTPRGRRTADEIVAEAIAETKRQGMARLEQIVVEELVRIERPIVRDLVRTVAQAAMHMTDDELGWQLEDWMARRERRRLGRPPSPFTGRRDDGDR